MSLFTGIIASSIRSASPFNGTALALLSVGLSSNVAPSSGYSDYVWTNTILDSGWGFAGSTATIVIPTGVTLLKYSFVTRTTAFSLSDISSLLNLNGTDVAIRTKDSSFWLPGMMYGMLKVSAGDTIKMRRYLSSSGPNIQANATQFDLIGF